MPSAGPFRFVALHGDTPLATNPLVLAGGLLVLTGFLFKVAAVPFHMWTPDAYQGAPTSVTGFMSAGAKAAGFAALLRIVLRALPSLAQLRQRQRLPGQGDFLTFPVENPG